MCFRHLSSPSCDIGTDAVFLGFMGIPDVDRGHSKREGDGLGLKFWLGGRGKLGVVRLMRLDGDKLSLRRWCIASCVAVTCHPLYSICNQLLIHTYIRTVRRTLTILSLLRGCRTSQTGRQYGFCSVELDQECVSGI